MVQNEKDFLFLNVNVPFFNFYRLYPFDFKGHDEGNIKR